MTTSPSTTSNVVIVGAGLAGMLTALKLSPQPVTVIASTALDATPGSAWAQGGIAAAIGDDDTTQAHAMDTIRAGGSIVDEDLARQVTSEAAKQVDNLCALGVPFDQEAEGSYKLYRAAAHTTERVARVKGDRTGQTIISALIAKVRATPSITILEGYEAQEIITEGEGPQRRAIGLYLARADDAAARYKMSDLSCIVLATGGIGALYRLTTNPSHARGDGLAIGARAGAIVSNAEFVQFHPTAIDVDRDPVPVAIEALRAAGATLIDGNGRRFMVDVRTDLELAPPDVTALAVHNQIASGNGCFLDCTQAIGGKIADHFPTVYRNCMEAGIDPSIEPIPIAPAAHYHMGGLRTDATGRTNVDGLWAVGEVAATGLHGANLLAGNALLETAVMSTRAAEDIVKSMTHRAASTTGTISRERSPHLPDFGARAAGLAMIRETMSTNAGLERDDERLRQALATLKDISNAGRGDAGEGDPVIENATIAARFVVEAALRRRESRGAHVRTDYPDADPEQARGRTMTLTGLTLRDSLASGELFSEITAAGGTLH